MKLRLFLLVLALFTSTGCAFAGIGAGVGSMFPKTEQVADGETLSRSTEVDVHADDGSTIASGNYRGVEGGEILLQRRDDVVRVARDRVGEVRKHTGSHWLSGMLVGMAIDAVLIGCASFYFVQSFGAGLSSLGAM
jgi:hypothetical protein